MRKRIILRTLVALVAVLGVAQANAGDRFFEVQVKNISPPQDPQMNPPAASPPGPNCYTFQENGVWIDPPWPGGAGAWTADSDGVVLRYTATAVFAGGEIFPGGPVFPPLLLVQEGQITPSFAHGESRLKAVTKIYLYFDQVAGPVIATFVSTGHEADGC